MEFLSKELFQTHGCDEQTAFFLAAKLKYDASDYDDNTIFHTTRHLDSHLRHKWLDRVMRQCAILQVSKGKWDVSADELSVLSGHAQVVEDLDKEEKMVDELLKSGRKERAEGFLTCKNPSCKSREVDVEQKQTRSADEPMTLFALCTKCGNRWTMK